MRYLFVVVLLVFSFTVEAECSRPIRSAWNHWPPYSMENNTGDVSGLDIELLQRIAKEAGCQLQWAANIPSSRQLMYLTTGEQDIQFAASVTPERREFAWFSPSYRTETIVLFAKHGTRKRFDDLTKLKQLRDRNWGLIAPFQGWYGAEYETIRPVLEHSVRLRQYKTTEQALELLDYNQGELALGDLYSFLYNAKQVKMPAPDVLNVPVNEGSIHLMYSKKAMPKQDVVLFNAAIQRLQKNGELSKIIKHYGIDD
jgi:polar amino acid transport system substrate-binding protein